jgi:broad specificity phosphatase PhoE
MSQRILYLIRHGQYDTSRNLTDARGGGLTAFGKKQARLMAQRLSRLPISAIHHSTLRRAEETAAIVALKFPGLPLRPSPLLREVVPSLPPALRDFFTALSPEEVERGRHRAERAFDKYFRRARREPQHEIVVCHGNIIRYFVCRVLQAPLDLWLNTDVHHCGISEVLIKSDGRMTLVSHNDTGHLPPHMRTYT